MHVVLGATGHVGSAVARELLRRGEKVIAVAHHPEKAEGLRLAGAEIAVCDVHDADALRAVLKRGKRAFLLNPPAAPNTDTDAEERKTVKSILAALDASGLERVVAASTSGAQLGDRLGDLNVLYEFEQGLKAQPIPVAINRGAYYFSNWDGQLETIRETGKLSTMFPVDFALPMVAPEDLGGAAARRLLAPVEETGIREVEGPRRYSAADVAAAFAEELGRPVEAVAIARKDWIGAFKSFGFSDAAAESYAGMTGATLDGEFAPLKETDKGPTTLKAYVEQLVKG